MITYSNEVVPWPETMLSKLATSLHPLNRKATMRAEHTYKLFRKTSETEFCLFSGSPLDKIQ